MSFLLNRGLTMENRDATERSEYPVIIVGGYILRKKYLMII